MASAAPAMVADPLPRIAAALTPAVMVPACGLLALGLDNQAARFETPGLPPRGPIARFEKERLRTGEAPPCPGRERRLAMGSSGPVLLVVHDDEVRRSLSNFLRHFWFLVRAAGTGDEAFTQLAKRPLPKLVLLDLSTPGLNGPDYQPFLRLCDELGDLPFVFLSSPGEVAEPPLRSLVHQPLDVLDLLRTLERQLRPGRAAEVPVPGPARPPSARGPKPPPVFMHK